MKLPILTCAFILRAICLWLYLCFVAWRWVTSPDQYIVCMYSQNYSRFFRCRCLSLPITRLCAAQKTVFRWSQIFSCASGPLKSAVHQIVEPSVRHQQVLSVTHESQWSGHLGVTKTEVKSSHPQNFFWLDELICFCSCHICQVTGKPNQTVPRAPLHPIPATEEQLEVVIVLFPRWGIQTYQGQLLVEAF